MPLRSPRETNGAFAASILRSAATMSLPPPICAGSDLRTDQHEVVVHDREALHALAFGQELLLGGLGVHEDDVGIAAPADVERLAGAQRDDADLHAGLLLVDGQQVTEQPRLLGRRGRCDRDEALLRNRRERTQNGGDSEHCGVRKCGPASG